MVFQRLILFPYLSILDNYTCPYLGKKMPKKEAEELALKQLKQVQIDDQANKYPGQLSGGTTEMRKSKISYMEPKIMLLMNQHLHWIQK